MATYVAELHDGTTIVFDRGTKELYVIPAGHPISRDPAHALSAAKAAISSGHGFALTGPQLQAVSAAVARVALLE